MGFVQIIEFSTTKIDEMKRLGDEWEAAAGTERRSGRRVLCRDRDQEDRYLNIVFFDSYEDAMANSELPSTQEFSGRLMAMIDGAPTFSNLEVLGDRDLS